ncbi:MAG: recombinase family protein [Armatimonas sp.]
MNAYGGTVVIMPGEAAVYARRSVAGEGSGKSIEDQVEVCVEIATEYQLPLSADNDIYREKPGFSGDIWWEGGGSNGLLTVEDAQYRPMMTKVMHGVRDGMKKLIVVWSSDRLFRDVGMAKAFVDVLTAKKALLFDRNGYVPLETPDQRAAFYSAIVAAQHYREMCQVNSPRGVKKNLDKGVNCMNANILGFRSGPKKGQVIHIPEEQNMVRRIFQLYLDGNTTYDIAFLLMEEGYSWTPDILDTRGNKRNEFTLKVIYRWQVRHLLKESRYQGRQRLYKEEYPCPSYLVDGITPVVDTATFQAVQKRLKDDRRSGNSTRKNRAFTGLLRCGLCGQGMQCLDNGLKGPNGESAKKAWRMVRTESWCWCTHKPPSIPEVTLDRYADDILGPLLLEELRERALLRDRNVTLDEQAIIERDLREAEHYYEYVLPTFDEISPTLLKRKEDLVLDKIAGLKARYKELAEQIRSFDAIVPTLEDISSVSPEERRALYRSVLRWIAVFPGSEEREPYPYPSVFTRPSKDAGTVVFLTAWGTYHTVKVERVTVPGLRRRQNELRPATISELVDGVSAFPDPDAFLQGLERAWKGGKYGFSLAEAAPGFTARVPPQVAEFDAELLKDDALMPAQQGDPHHAVTSSRWHAKSRE